LLVILPSPAPSSARFLALSLWSEYEQLAKMS
jgi:hypothetical protein